jgi:nucleoid-associated protein Lsr2
MATRTVKIDDFDGTSEATECPIFSLGPEFFEIDLSKGNADKLRADLAPWMKVARPIAGREALRRASLPVPNGVTGNGYATTSANGSVNGQGNGQMALPEFDPPTVRAWLLANGHQVQDKGRIPENLVWVWYNATHAVNGQQPQLSNALQVWLHPIYPGSVMEPGFSLRYLAW